MMGRIGAILCIVGMLSACGRQPPLSNSLPQTVEKQCLDRAESVADCTK